MASWLIPQHISDLHNCAISMCSLEFRRWKVVTCPYITSKFTFWGTAWRTTSRDPLSMIPIHIKHGKPESISRYDLKDFWSDELIQHHPHRLKSSCSQLLIAKRISVIISPLSEYFLINRVVCALTTALSWEAVTCRPPLYKTPNGGCRFSIDVLTKRWPLGWPMSWKWIILFMSIVHLIRGHMQIYLFKRWGADRSSPLSNQSCWICKNMGTILDAFENFSLITERWEQHLNINIAVWAPNDSRYTHVKVLSLLNKLLPTPTVRDWLNVTFAV